MKVKLIAIAVLAATLAACSTTPNVVKEAREAERIAAKQVEKAIDRSPSWYLEPPETTREVVFVTGTSTSNNMSMSRNKAILDAQAQLADQLNALVSGMTKQYMRDAGVNTTSTVEDTEMLTRKLIAEANVAGYRVEKIEVYPEGRYFRTYVMLAYPIGETNTIRAQQEQAQMLRALPEQKAKAFDELDALIQERQ